MGLAINIILHLICVSPPTFICKIWKLCKYLFFSGISTLIQTYRGKYGIIEYVVAGGTTGALYKFNMGPRGWVVGGGLGEMSNFINQRIVHKIFYRVSVGLFLWMCHSWLAKINWNLNGRCKVLAKLLEEFT